MNPKSVLQILGELRVMRFFPNDANVMVSLLRLVGAMCENEEQVKWLVARMTSGIYSAWPGDHEMRACFCCRYKPKDGMTAYSTVYLDGLPPDPTAPQRPQIGTTGHFALPEGHVSADPERDRAIIAGAEAVKMPTVRGEAKGRFARILKEIAIPPQDRPMRPAPDPISQERRSHIQAQIDHILRERRRA
jgi:hypothetical protein